MKQHEHTPSTRFVWNAATTRFQVDPSPQQSIRHFIKGPLPLEWIERAAALPGKALHVALAIWYQVGLERQSTITLGQKRLKRFAVSRDAKYDALRRLEQNGLVSVEQLPGKSPKITVNVIEESSANKKPKHTDF
ncbi:MAG: hypothetical protein H6935_11155 [Thiobacillus sp.]|nr:hypothetical protein [Thiobacillus sp.]